MLTHRQNVLQGKRLILFRHMLEAIACQDVKVVDEAAVGFNITRVIPASGVFEARTADNAVQGHSKKCRLSKAKELREALVQSTRTRRTTDPTMTQEVYNKTMGEVEKGWVSGSARPTN